MLRRAFLGGLAASVPLPLAARPADAPLAGLTGRADPRLAPFDDLLRGFVAEHAVPGASLAVGIAGKLVYARGCGFADLAARTPVEPRTLFRIASVSKPITAVAVLRAAEKRKLHLDDKIMKYLPQRPFPAPGTTFDRRIDEITIRQCLRHTAGWDREISGDPVFRPLEIAAALGIRPPVGVDDVTRYMLGRPLDFAPGTRYAYSNFGYLALGRVLAAVAGEPYEKYVKDDLLMPLGCTAMRLGRALREHRAEHEAVYYDEDDRTGPAVFPPLDRRLPLQYGAQNLDAFEAHGGWLATAAELVRFASSFDGFEGRRLLGPSMFAEMTARPATSAEDVYYGCGWQVRAEVRGEGCDLWHAGSIDGSESLLVRRRDGLVWAILFNTRRRRPGASLAGKIDPLLHRAAAAVRTWPTVDRFAEIGS